MIRVGEFATTVLAGLCTGHYSQWPKSCSSPKGSQSKAGCLSSSLATDDPESVAGSMMQRQLGVRVTVLELVARWQAAGHSGQLGVGQLPAMKASLGVS